ncbi:glutathionylspermidine synthase family protein [Halomonas binhaiensis]|uniref:Glutathionylspermidine synthase family protein n=1 Tax=Halomonas binhaiensis TaxID=2562282 RepID=A0A5C1NE71_9GAMM|nr:glutathionylspermidine synthase family protein [Halomonas binhaiensis]
MIRCNSRERPGWKRRAEEFGFRFHSMYGQVYWDESVHYQFTLEQIERDLEEPTAELHQMCLSVVEDVVNDERLLRQFRIPEEHWSLIAGSWRDGDKSLYSRLDLAYDGRGPAKLFENNADTPTSLYETGFWQWLWLEDMVNAGEILRSADQFNSVQEKLVNRFVELQRGRPGETLHLACCKDSEEDRGTVQYLEDCANEAGIPTRFVYIEDIGHGEGDVFTDLDDQVITWMFKLYPWEFMLREEYGSLLSASPTQWLEPPWKAVLSNKALLPLLWQKFPGHPNLLPAYFEESLASSRLNRYVKKPIFAREGANVSIHIDGEQRYSSPGPYGEEGFIYQEYCPLPKFGDNYALIGSWLIDDLPAGISVREDKDIVTQDLSRYIPHVILG